MRLPLLFVLLTTGASAQSMPDVRPTRLTRTERIVVAVAGTAAAVLVPMDDDLSLYTVASPVVVGAVVYGAGRALGSRGRLGPTLAGAAAGTLPALGLFTVSNNLDEGFWWYLGASVASIAGPVAGAVIGFDRSQVSVSPAVLRAPDGERSAGLSLRVGL